MCKLELIMSIITTIVLLSGCTKNVSKDISKLSDDQQAAILAVRKFEERIGTYNETDILLYKGTDSITNEDISFILLNRISPVIIISDDPSINKDDFDPYIFYKDNFYDWDYCIDIARELQGNDANDFINNYYETSQIELKLYDCILHALDYELGEDKDGFTYISYEEIRDYI